MFHSLLKNLHNCFIKSVYGNAKVTQDLKKGIKQLMKNRLSDEQEPTKPTYQLHELRLVQLVGCFTQVVAKKVIEIC